MRSASILAALWTALLLASCKSEPAEPTLLGEWRVAILDNEGGSMVIPSDLDLRHFFEADGKAKFRVDHYDEGEQERSETPGKWEWLEEGKRFHLEGAARKGAPPAPRVLIIEKLTPDSLVTRLEGTQERTHYFRP